MSLLFALEDTHRAPNYGILDCAPIPQGLCFHWGEENGGKRLKKPHLYQIIGVTANVNGGTF